MLIRTQNKIGLIDITNLVIGIDDKNNIAAYSTNALELYDYLKLGTYSTKDKAIKALDMIQKTYEDANNFHYVANRVFIMPADEEVI